jgi:hypothetical protein
LKKPASLIRFRFYKQKPKKPNRTETKNKPEKNQAKPSQNRAKPEKPSQTEKTKQKPSRTGLNRFFP